MKTKIKHKHKFMCSDIPGYYICECNEWGKWNPLTRKIEVIKDMHDAGLCDHIYDSYCPNCGLDS